MAVKAPPEKEDLKQEIQMRILMSEFSKDDPKIQALMLKKIIESYEERGRDIPQDVKKYLQKEALDIYNKLKKDLLAEKRQTIAETKKSSAAKR